MNLVTIEHLTKSYTERLLFEDTAFSIQEGEKVGLIGINGTGKSTLLRIVAGLRSRTAARWSGPESLYTLFAQVPRFEPGDTVLGSIIRDNERSRSMRQEKNWRLRPEPCSTGWESRSMMQRWRSFPAVRESARPWQAYY